MGERDRERSGGTIARAAQELEARLAAPAIERENRQRQVMRKVGAPYIKRPPTKINLKNK